MGTAFAKGTRCQVSDPANPHDLSKGDVGNPPSGCLSCSGQSDGPYSFHYHCITCNVGFHSHCVTYPRKIRHPYHFQHPLTFNASCSKTGERCNWCGDARNPVLYRCLICGFCLDRYCASKYPPLTIANPESHHHPLTFFPRPFSLPCDACGLVDILDPAFTCLQCNYMVHRSCINLPREIKITRHPHRLSYTPFFPPESSTCQICYKAVDIKYGQYSCYCQGCSYVAHSKCAAHGSVWDGVELEWEPDESNEAEDIVPFEKVGLDLIKYFCHEHHLKLQKYNRVRDADKQCQACISPIDSHDFYNCMRCAFFLHEVCANLPRKLDHALHRHPLVLEPSPLDDSTMECSACHRLFSGFQYRCSNSDCRGERMFQVDIRCILVPDCFTHKSHEHPLFISTFSKNNEIFKCNRCNSRLVRRLQCTQCEYSLCYYCTTIPTEVYYKHDEHPLSLCFGEEVNNATYWCEICERKLDPAKWFYSCTQCCITIHCKCILGSSMYMKYGYAFCDGSNKPEVVRNSSNTRPICYVCDHRCHDSKYYKIEDRCYCSLDCSRFPFYSKQLALPS